MVQRDRGRRMRRTSRESWKTRTDAIIHAESLRLRTDHVEAPVVDGIGVVLGLKADLPVEAHIDHFGCQVRGYVIARTADQHRSEQGNRRESHENILPDSPKSATRAPAGSPARRTGA